MGEGGIKNLRSRIKYKSNPDLVDHYFPGTGRCTWFKGLEEYGFVTKVGLNGVPLDWIIDLGIGQQRQ